MFLRERPRETDARVDEAVRCSSELCSFSFGEVWAAWSARDLWEHCFQHADWAAALLVLYGYMGVVNYFSLFGIFRADAKCERFNVTGYSIKNSEICQ